MKTNNGFTLIEVVIAVAIVAVLASIALPSYQDQVERGNLSECASFAYSLASKLEQNFSVTLSYPENLSDIAGLSLNSESGKCAGTIESSCVDERCIGYNLAVSRITSSRAKLRSQCETLTLSHRGEKGAFDKSGDVSDIDLCWR